MNWLKTVWDNKKSWLWDSTVVIDWKKCFKLYPRQHFSPSDIEFYQDVQNNLGSFILISKKWFRFWFFKKKLHTVKVEFLNLWQELYEASDISDRLRLLVSEVPYVEWETLGDLNEKFFSPVDIDFLRNLVKWIEESSLSYYDTWTNMPFGYDPILNYQINPYNIKVKKIDRENWELHLIITDISTKAFRFIQKNKHRVLGLIT